MTHPLLAFLHLDPVPFVFACVLPSVWAPSCIGDVACLGHLQLLLLSFADVAHLGCLRLLSLSSADVARLRVAERVEGRGKTRTWPLLVVLMSAAVAERVEQETAMVVG